MSVYIPRRACLHALHVTDNTSVLSSKPGFSFRLPPGLRRDGDLINVSISSDKHKPHKKNRTPGEQFGKFVEDFTVKIASI